MGPFKHTVDDGLDLRKAAFECMYTLLDSCLDRIDIFTFLNHVEDGLKDHYDIKVRPHATTQILQHQGPFEIVLILETDAETHKHCCSCYMCYCGSTRFTCNKEKHQMFPFAKHFFFFSFSHEK